MNLDGNGPTIPNNSPRRCRTARPYKPPRSFHSPFEEGNELDLSIHHPKETLGNRFEALRRNSLPIRRSEEYSSLHRRRPRSSRGSKDGKKRRDARRNRYKFAAIQMLDDQLYQDVDKTLRWANVRKPVAQSGCDAISRPPTITTSQQKPVYAPTAPSELAYFNFEGPNVIRESPQLMPAKLKALPPPPTRPPLRPLLPSWCPDLPAFSQSFARSDEMPVFFDLSKLPEPPETAKTVSPCRELQLWRPKVERPRKQQPEAVPPVSSKNSHGGVRSTACKLHRSDLEVRDASTQTDADTLPPKVYSVTEEIDKMDDGQATHHPANLWRILNEPQQSKQVTNDDSYVNSFTYNKPINYNLASLSHADELDIEETATPPRELDATEIPFVHANSLTGYANERATFQVAESDERSVNFGSVAGAQDTGLNELAIDQFMEEGYADAVLAALELPPLPPSPELGSAVPAFAVAASARREHGEGGVESAVTDDAHAADAQFRSERALFIVNSPSIRRADENLSDAVSSFGTDHALNCSCEDCEDPPELVHLDEDNDKEQDEDEEEWMDFLALNNTRTRSPSVSSAWEAEWGVLVGKAHDWEEDDGEGSCFWDSLGLCARASGAL